MTITRCAWAFLVLTQAVCEYRSSSLAEGAAAGPPARPLPGVRSQPLGKTLPKGFLPVEGSALDPSGWPKEIRCVSDESIMVFVPAGSFRSGLDNRQLKALIVLEGNYDDTVKQQVKAKADAIKALQSSDGPLLNTSDLKDLDTRDADSLTAIVVLSILQEQKIALPGERLDRWRRQGRPLDSLLAIPGVQEHLGREQLKSYQAMAGDAKRLGGLLGLLGWIKPTPGELLTAEDLRDLGKMNANQQTAVFLLSMLEAIQATIPADDLQTWRHGGRTLEGLFQIPAVPRSLVQEELRKITEFLANPEAQYRESFSRPKEIQTPVFYIDKYEITNRQYRRFFKESNDPQRRPGLWYGGGSSLYRRDDKFYDFWGDARRNADDQPVACVGEKDVLAYAKWAGKQLPPRDLWQRAALGDDGRLFPWGSDFQVGYCDCDVKSSRRLRDLWRKPTPGRVGQFPHDVSPYGCHDMAGNVSEWVLVGNGSAGEEPGMTAMGGNTSSSWLKYVCPAMDHALESSGKLLGFRTILIVDPGR